MAKLPFERASQIVQTNRLGAPQVPKAAAPLNVMNSAGVQARYQALRSFGDALGSLGEVMAVQINNENREAKRLQLMDIQNMFDQSGQQLISDLNEKPPQDIESAQAMVNLSLYGDVAGKPAKNIGGLYGAITNKYGNSREVQELFEKVAIDQRFRAKAVGIQQQQYRQTNELKDRYFTQTQELLAQEITPDVLNQFSSKEAWADHTATQLENLETELFKGVENQAIVNNVRSDIMRHMFATQEALVTKWQSIYNEDQAGQLIRAGRNLKADATLTNKEKLAKWTHTVNQEVQANRKTPAQAEKLFFDFHRDLDLSLANQMLDQNPQELLRVLTYEGNGKKRTEEGFEFETFDNTTVSQYRVSASKKVNALINAEINTAFSRADQIIQQATITDDHAVLENELVESMEVLGKAHPNLATEINGKIAAFDKAVLVRQELKNIGTYSKKDLDQKIEELKPDPYADDIGTPNEFYMEEMRQWNVFKSAVADVYKVRKEDPRFVYEQSRPEYQQEELYGGAFSQNEIAAGLREQMEWGGIHSQFINESTKPRQFNPERLNYLLDSGNYQLWSKATHQKLISRMSQIQSGKELAAFYEQIARDSGVYAPFVFKMLKNEEKQLGIGFTHGDYLITEVSQDPVKEILFSAQSNSKTNRNSLNSIFITQDGDSVSLNEIESLILNDQSFISFYSSLGVNERDRAAKQKEVLDTTVDYFLEKARIFGVTIPEGGSRNELEPILNQTMEDLFDDNYVFINASRSAYFSDHQHTLAINKKHLEDKHTEGFVNDAVNNFVDNWLEYTKTELSDDPVNQKYIELLQEGNWRLAPAPNNDGIMMYVLDENTGIYNVVRRIGPYMTAEDADNAPPVIIGYDRIRNLTDQEIIADRSMMDSVVYPLVKELKSYVEHINRNKSAYPRKQNPSNNTLPQVIEEQPAETDQPIVLPRDMPMGNFVRPESKQVDQLIEKSVAERVGISPIEDLDKQVMSGYVESSAQDNPTDYPSNPIYKEEAVIQPIEAAAETKPTSQVIDNISQEVVAEPKIATLPAPKEPKQNLTAGNAVIQKPKVNTQKRFKELRGNYEAMTDILKQVQSQIETQMLDASGADMEYLKDQYDLLHQHMDSLNQYNMFLDNMVGPLGYTYTYDMQVDSLDRVDRGFKNFAQTIVLFRKNLSEYKTKGRQSAVDRQPNLNRIQNLPLMD